MKKSIYVIALSVLFLTACKNEKKQANLNEMQMEEMNMSQHNEEKTMMGNSSEDAMGTSTMQSNSNTSEIIDAYLQLKNALAADNKDKAAEAGKNVIKAFSKFDMSKLSEAQHKTYMEIVENSNEHAEHIIKSPIDHQREHFEELSSDMNDLIALLGTNKTLYVTFCPMYNKKGATWLSETETIKNPYFGSKMLSCGEVKSKIN